MALVEPGTGPSPLIYSALPARHGFFTRQGGVSTGPYASLNASLSGGDDPDRVSRNRARIAASLGVPATHLLGLSQVHGARVITLTHPWPAGAGPAADAMVTAVSGIALGIITADCAPVLFADAHTNIVGAAHAGWRGAVAGVLEATLAAMRGLGATDILAVIGPCIGQVSYQVGDDMQATVLAASPWAASCFAPDPRPAHARFDLAAYCARRLVRAGATAHILGPDTCAEPERFFSHRRRTLAGGGPIGHQLSAIVA